METTKTENGTVALAVREERSSIGFAGTVQITNLPQLFQLAARLADAKGFVPKHLLGDANGIAAAILTGIELGLGPMESMRSIHIVDGKPTMAADLMLARAIRAGIKPTWIEQSAKMAALRLERPGFRAHEHRFTWAEAEAAELTKKDNWRKYPAEMVRARTVAAAMRAYCPDVLGSGVYSPDELEAEERTEATQDAKSQTRIVEVEDGEVIELPKTFAECSDGVVLKAFCKENRKALSTLANGKRKTAIERCAEAAARCEVDVPIALAWAGLVDGTEVSP